jgi:predicted DNA-binding transcriptional regulator AlpA
LIPSVVNGITERTIMIENDRGRLLHLSEIIDRTRMPEGTVRSRYHSGTMPFLWKLGRRLVAWEGDLVKWMDQQRQASTKNRVQRAEYEEGPDFTRISFTVTWKAREGEFYYRPDERRGLLEGWISQALDDRDDCPTPHFGPIPEDRILDWPAVDEDDSDRQ